MAITAAAALAGPSRFVANASSPFADSRAIDLPPFSPTHTLESLSNGHGNGQAAPLRVDASATSLAPDHQQHQQKQQQQRQPLFLNNSNHIYHHLPVPKIHAMATATPSSSAADSDTSSVRSSSVRSASGRSSSLHSASVHSSTRERLGGVFARRGSALANGRRPKSSSSNQSGSVAHPDDEHFEMSTMSRSKKKRIVEDIEQRVERAKADAALGKWRRWIADQPVQEADTNPILPISMYGTIGTVSSSGYHGGSSSYHQSSSYHHGSNHYHPPPVCSLFPQSEQSAYSSDHSAEGSSSVAGMNGMNAVASGSGSAHRSSWRGSIGGPIAPQWVSSENNTSSSEASHAHPMTPHSTHPSLVPGSQDIYLTESVRMLRDVELAVDPEYLEQHASPETRTRRLSTHPRLSDMENPFSSIDTLLARRGIRPLVLELVHALGAYIDAVWATTHPGRPCAWAGVPVPAAVRRASVAVSVPAPKTWHSWTLTAVKEARRQGFLPTPPNLSEVAFWGWEVRYGLRDIDEAVNRRKDLGWAFGEVVIRGQYGDIVSSNVFAPDGGGGNLCRLLNDLEEALWGDAVPTLSDLAFEHDPDFDPFSVYREGDELIGVESYSKGVEAREVEMRMVFGDCFAMSSFGRATSPPTMPMSPTSPISPRLPSRSPTTSPATSCVRPLVPMAMLPERSSGGHADQVPALSLPSSPKSRYDGSPRTPGDSSVLVMPDLDFSALGALQEMTMDEKLELGRRRHQEYLERTRLEDAISQGTPGIAM